MAKDRVEERLRQIELWINSNDKLVDYVDISKKFGIKESLSRTDVTRIVKRGNVDKKKILYKIDGKNFFGDDIIRVIRKNPIVPGRKVSRIF